MTNEYDNLYGEIVAEKCERCGGTLISEHFEPKPSSRVISCATTDVSSPSGNFALSFASPPVSGVPDYSLKNLVSNREFVEVVILKCQNCGFEKQVLLD
jgi:hypothetical protein